MINKPYGYTSDYFLWRATKLKSQLAKYISIDGKILDVGGGFGIMAQFLPDFIDKKNYYNLDISAEILKYSSYNNILAPAEQIPCPDSFFDYVISSEALQHVNDKIRVLNECYRVIKPGGLFLLSAPRTGWLDDFKRSIFLPFLIIDTTLNIILPRKSDFQMPDGVKNDPEDERWLLEKLGIIGFEVLTQFRADNHVPWSKGGESKFWRWFADKFVDPKKYGHCTIVVSKAKKLTGENHQNTSNF